MVGRLSNKDYITIIELNQIENYPMKLEGICIAKNIFGPELGTLKGKTTKTKSIPVHQTLLILQEALKLHTKMS